MEIIKVTSLYETKPFGIENQPNFLNAVIECSTELNLNEVFNYIKRIETKIGRKERFRWGPREIDIDILLFNEQIVQNEQLEIPHKDLLIRDFVYIPLLEINNILVHPSLKKPISDLILDKSYKYILRKMEFTYNKS